MSPALSGILSAFAVFIWAGVVAFWSRRWAVWAVTFLSIIAFNLWKPAIEAEWFAGAVWASGFACLTGLVTLVVLIRRGAE